MRHEVIEKSVNLMMVLIVLAVSIGGLVEILPLMVSDETTEPAENIEPYSPLRLAGREYRQPPNPQTEPSSRVLPASIRLS